MNSEVKKRKKRFWAFCLVFVLMLGNVMPMSVMAKEYDVSFEPGGREYYIDADILQPGDVIKPTTGFNSGSIKYYDVDGITSLDNISEEFNRDSVQVTVKEYNGRQITSDAFKGWKVNQIDASGGIDNIQLSAVAYTQSNITYILNGGTNDSANPGTYYEGKEEIILQPATKECYTFEGWYRDEAFTDQVTAISKTQTGDITLYAKFTPAVYNITYIVDGEEYQGDPATYTFGTSVGSFADASKEGYTFEGWYKELDFSTKVDAIHTDQTGAIILFAKFTSNQPSAQTYNINYELNGGTNGAGNPASYTSGTGVAGFAAASKEGYTFDGWYSDAEFTTKVTYIPAELAEDITLYAKFVEKTSEKTESKKEEKEGQGEPYCTHNFVYTVFQEATETQDGLVGMQCSFCGAVKENSMEAVSAYQIFTRLCEKKIREAKGTELTIETGIWVSFHKSIMAALAEKPDLNLTINYTYQHKKYTVTIPAGTDVMALLNEDGYCGFRYLDQQFGGKEIQ